MNKKKTFKIIAIIAILLSISFLLIGLWDSQQNTPIISAPKESVVHDKNNNVIKREKSKPASKICTGNRWKNLEITNASGESTLYANNDLFEQYITKTEVNSKKKNDLSISLSQFVSNSQSEIIIKACDEEEYIYKNTSDFASNPRFVLNKKGALKVIQDPSEDKKRTITKYLYSMHLK